MQYLCTYRADSPTDSAACSRWNGIRFFLKSCSVSASPFSMNPAYRSVVCAHTAVCASVHTLVTSSAQERKRKNKTTNTIKQKKYIQRPARAGTGCSVERERESGNDGHYREGRAGQRIIFVGLTNTRPADTPSAPALATPLGRKPPPAEHHSVKISEEQFGVVS